MLFAQRLALKQEVPLHVCFCLVPKFLDATIRQYGFMLKGLQEVEQVSKLPDCRSLEGNFWGGGGGGCLDGAIRQYGFMLKRLQEIEQRSKLTVLQ